MSVSIIQRRNADVASTTSTTLSFVGPTTPGNAIIVCARIGGTSTAAITDDKAGGSNVYAADVSLLHSGLGTAYIFSAPNAGSATTLTITLTGGATTIRWAFYEVSGLATSSPLDQISSLYTATGASFVNSGNTPTTTQASEWLFGVCATNAPETVSAGPSQSYVLEDAIPANPQARLVTEDVTVSATGAYQADFGVTTGTDHVVLIATYKLATGGGSTALLGVIIEPSSGPQGVTQQVSSGWL